ncbi:exonuclease domain-containing protein [Paraburkholderia unamae]|uniref:DNA-directed DNA polymerase n=1 Tax=Paraburkholderia unamae TaxID=219649 RepID=A0ABX5KNK4_9BURK|nr:exonuclease domain-containing protein [Paraburkholderia unamae]PVX83883.1 DNA polymerase-3 subunit epsilon [Paraburkholderia unamae]CAG9264680.1 DNA polymerase III epsilon subunit [Paraburkholderia unamae]
MLESSLNAAQTAGDLPLVFVDLETTGGSVGEHRITEVGVVEVAQGQVTRWSTLVDPGQSIPPFIQQLTGITDKMVRGAPSFADIAAGLYERLAGKLFIAHNAAFDRGFLRAEFERAGYSFNPDVLCTVRLSRALFPGEKRHGLDALVERHALVPSDRHRALADADLLWQFWQRLPALVPEDALAAQIERTTRRHVLAGDITDELIDTAPAGHGVYAFYGENDVPLYVGRSVRVRQRVRSHLSGDRRSSREQRMAQQVRRVEWRATGGELGALLVEAQWIAMLKPSFNRLPRVSKRDPADLGAAPWPFGGAVLVQEQDNANGADVFHLIDRWCYVGAFASSAEAALLADPAVERAFELSTWRILQSRFERGLSVQVLQPSEADGLTSPA